MAGKDSSSKRKSSKRKRDKTSSKKKSRRKESKRHNRIQDSVPSLSDDVSSNSEHTSKSNHKRRIIMQKSKKPRREYTTSSSSDDLSLSSDSDSDSSLRRKARRSLPNLKKKSRERSKRSRGEGDTERSGKKRKRSGKDDVVKPKKKKSSKKNIKRYLSSDSESGSISQSISSIDTADRKRRRSKLILDDENERPRGRELYKSRKMPRIRSLSRSSCDRGSKLSVGDGSLSPVNDDYNYINNNSRRLKSVIAVVDQRYDEEENKLDPYKEEIVYDRNDYPTPKSPDSNEEETKMELDEVELKSSMKDGDQNNDGTNNFEKEKETENSVPVAEIGGDVLESILRQKALENLKKFKGSLQTRPMSTNNLKVSEEKTENVENEPTKPDFQELNQNSGPSLKGEISEIAEVKKLSDGENVEKEPEMATQPVEQLTEPVSKIDTCTGGEITNVGGDLVSEPSSSIGQTMTGEKSLEGGNEAKDGSQFEQKTMTVMKGGEMVQVSYKVYIPKKAPALARRPIKR